MSRKLLKACKQSGSSFRLQFAVEDAQVQFSLQFVSVLRDVRR